MAHCHSIGVLCNSQGGRSRGFGGSIRGGGGRGRPCYVVQYSTELEQLGIIYSKRILPVHIITNNQQMANKLLHVLFPYKVSKITQHSK